MESIWKDYSINLGTDDSIRFRISLEKDGTIVYTGTSVKRPGEQYNTIRINDICADYLKAELPSLIDRGFTASDLPVIFEVYTYIGDSWGIVESVQFVNDWSYDYDHDVDVDGIADPINGHVDPRQPLVWSGLNVTEVRADITYKNGTSSFVILPVELTPDFDWSDFNEDFTTSLRSAGSGSAVFNLGNVQDIAKVTIDGKEYPVTDVCARYVLYYLNAFGGWDSFLIEGSTRVFDNITRYTTKNEYDNTDSANRGRKNFVNEVSRTLQMTTGWLSDRESERMHHLINSTNVYVFDLVDRRMYPALIPGTSQEYKTYKTNGARLVNYTIDVELANGTTRR